MAKGCEHLASWTAETKQQALIQTRLPRCSGGLPTPVLANFAIHVLNHYPLYIFGLSKGVAVQ